MPGVGISIGLSRLFFQLMDNNIISAEKESLTKALIVSMTENYEYCAKIANTLRQNGIKVQINFEDQKIGKKFKYANNIKVQNVIIIGEDEITNNKITIKNMNTGEQKTLTLEEMVAELKE